MLRRLTKRINRRDQDTVAPAKTPRQSASLRSIMTWTNIVSILTASLVAGYYALTVLYENKLVDTWAIMFLDLEHQGTLLAERLAAVNAGPAKSPDSVLRLGAGGQLQVEQGPFGPDLSLKDFRVSGDTLPRRLAPLTVLSYGGESFLVRQTNAEGAAKDQQTLKLRKVPVSAFDIRPAPPASQGALYLLTREGRLLYSSETSITELNVVARPLVQRFIAAPIKQGQTELIGGTGEALYGFFAEVPKTNIIMFSEVTRSAALAPVETIVVRFLVVLGLILVGAVIMLQLPLARITGPIKELAQMAGAVGQGRFDVAPSAKGLGELSVLTSAFSSMASGLVERDRKVAALIREQADKARLEGELAIARRIQENLLPGDSLPPDSGLTIASEYISAAECAGDWYHYFYNPTLRETVVIIADVSGHGAGSSMFTAIIAGLFDDFRSRRDRPFDMPEFARRANDVIFRLGRKQWHATMLMTRFVAGESDIELMIAGHPAPLLKSDADDIRCAITPPLRGSPALGASLDFQPLHRRLPFPKGACLLAYTDGLTEATNSTGKMFSRRRVRESLLKGSGDPHETLAFLRADWETYLADQAAGDDVCVIALRAA